MNDMLIDGAFNPVLIALGANLPGQKDSPLAQLQDAISLLADAGLRDVVVSRFYNTPCFPTGTGPDYANAVMRCSTDLGPQAILKILHGIEACAGRSRDGRWLARVLDLDLLAVGAQVLPDPVEFGTWADLPLLEQAYRAPDTLILPHPRIQDRAFVLVPLMDVAPDWVHPVFGRSVRQMVAALDPVAVAEIRPIVLA